MVCLAWPHVEGNTTLINRMVIAKPSISTFYNINLLYLHLSATELFFIDIREKP